MSDIEATLVRIQKHKGVYGTMVVGSNGQPLRSTFDENFLKQYPDAVPQLADLIPSLASLARNLVRDLDPQNDLEFLRIRSLKHEIMVAAKEDFVLIVLQDPVAAAST